MQETTESIDNTIVKRILSAIDELPTGVYRPSDDSFLMLEAISDFPFKGKVTLDMGTGSGILGLFAAIRGAVVTLADIDGSAIEHAAKSAKALGVHVNSVFSDLFSAIRGQFDVVLFNPPYLPSATPIDIATDGGPKGTTIIDRFLQELTAHLAKDGTAFLLLSTLNTPSSLIRKHREFSFSLVKKRSLFFEQLQVLRLGCRKSSGQ